jgi:hypothetical protein
MTRDFENWRSLEPLEYQGMDAVATDRLHCGDVDDAVTAPVASTAMQV